MKTLLSITALLLASLCCAPAQQPAATPAPAPPIIIFLKNGQAVTTYQALQRSGNAVMVTVPMANSTQGQMGYDVDTISHVEFPEPPQIQAAQDLISGGQLDQGLAELDAVLNYYAPFRDVPGSWWSKAAMLKINALSGVGRQTEAQYLISQLSSNSGDLEAVNAGRVQEAAEMGRRGSYEGALHNLDEVISQSKSKDTLAQAYYYEGESLRESRRFEPAVLAYLHVPVFYSDNKVLMPQAMLGGARAMIGLQDLKGAKEELDELVKNYPSSPQTAAAKAELDKLEKELSQKP